ncbi:MAG: hypothetical protein JST59_00115 [Actinobacteria bacterium]|nr:hypothetical protein [Actinomycetota bacterium]
MLRLLRLKFQRDIGHWMMRRCFEEWKKRLTKLRKALRILESYETLYFFYRTVVGWKFIQQKVNIITSKLLAAECKNLQKNLEEKLALLDKDSKEQARLEHSLKSLFVRFIRFETLSQNNRAAVRTTKKLASMFKHWQVETRRRNHLSSTMAIFRRLLDRHSQRIFMDRILSERYRAVGFDIKDQMSKLAKKKKSFEEKSAKSSVDVTRRL